MSAADARAMLDAGADLIQLYTGFIYEGPGLVRDICRALIADAERAAGEPAPARAAEESGQRAEAPEASGPESAGAVSGSRAEERRSPGSGQK